MHCVRPLSLVVFLTLALSVVVGSVAQTRPTDSQIPFMQVMPQDRVVSFDHVMWNLELVQTGPTNWGQLKIDPVVLSRKTKRDVSYINVFLYPEGSRQAFWVSENIPAGQLCPPELGETAAGMSRPALRRMQPVCRYVNLQPNMDMTEGALPYVMVIVLASAQPIPVSDDLLPAIQSFPRTMFAVGRVLENAEGLLPDELLNTFPPTSIHPTLPLGYPPAALTPEAGPITDIAFPQVIYQTDAPNFECAINQCVPMGQANAIQYLENRYDGLLLKWNVAELPISGFGKVNSAGDVLFWEPVPENSLVANVDAYTRRSGVMDANSGSGSDICQLFQGLFWYLTAAEPFTIGEFRHQGTNSAVIGDGATCDSGPFDMGGRQSVREGANPTWEWMFEQLTLGRGVTICFGRYDVNGNRTSGHCVRVWGASRFGSLKYIHTLDDGNQGANTEGTRTQVWQVADTGGPGAPGVPDGRLNMDGMSWEIEFANSIEAIPTLLLPNIPF